LQQSLRRGLWRLRRTPTKKKKAYVFSLVGARHPPSGLQGEQGRKAVNAPVILVRASLLFHAARGLPVRYTVQLLVQVSEDAFVERFQAP